VIEDNVELLKRVYDLFNSRDIDSVLAAMHPDVIWANGMEGGHVRGREGVRSYWKRQWAILNPHLEPVEISSNGEGEVVVKIHLVVRDPKGNLLADRMVIHVFQMQTDSSSVSIFAMCSRLAEPYRVALLVCSVGLSANRKLPETCFGEIDSWPPRTGPLVRKNFARPESAP
jgi:ketosteroid isomerase-like protein